jgi:hypothetical protein
MADGAIPPAAASLRGVVMGMTQQYLAGELSVLLERVQAVTTTEAAGREAWSLRVAAWRCRPGRGRSGYDRFRAAAVGGGLSQRRLRCPVGAGRASRGVWPGRLRPRAPTNCSGTGTFLSYS